MKLDKVIFIPSRIPPHRAVDNHVSVEHRLKMIRAAIKGDRRFEVSTFEADKLTPAYTIDTVKYFRKKYGPACRIFFMVGADWAHSLHTWNNAKELSKLVAFIIANRPGFSSKRRDGIKTKSIDIPHIDISSTMIRDRIKAKRPVSFFMPHEVEKYIRDNNLYGGNKK